MHVSLFQHNESLNRCSLPMDIGIIYTSSSCFLSLNFITTAPRTTTPSERDTSQNWRKLWNLQLPLKVKNFLKRACANYQLPTMQSLCSRKVINSSSSPLCRNSPEDTFHALLRCQAIQSVWGGSLICEDVDGGN